MDWIVRHIALGTPKASTDTALKPQGLDPPCPPPLPRHLDVIVPVPQGDELVRGALVVHVGRACRDVGEPADALARGAQIVAVDGGRRRVIGAAHSIDRL